MEWNVYYFNINKRKIETFNIFDHYTFVKYVKKYIKECETKEEFIKKLKSELIYYFGFKAEWEILISPWVGGDREDTIKIDVYEQVMINWNIFSDYVWNNRKEMLDE